VAWARAVGRAVEAEREEDFGAGFHEAWMEDTSSGASPGRSAESSIAESLRGEGTRRIHLREYAAVDFFFETVREGKAETLRPIKNAHLYEVLTYATTGASRPTGPHSSIRSLTERKRP
jgi:hypothetical protein